MDSKKPASTPEHADEPEQPDAPLLLAFDKALAERFRALRVADADGKSRFRISFA